MDVSKNNGTSTPKWMVKTMENPIKIDDLGVPLFLERPVCIQEEVSPRVFPKWFYMIPEKGFSKWFILVTMWILLEIMGSQNYLHSRKLTWRVPK